MKSDTTVRFNSADWFSGAVASNVIVGGAGGIGSWLTLFLARLGIDDILVYDFDHLEKHNLGGQFYTLRNVNNKELKVTALVNLVEIFTGSYIGTAGRYTLESIADLRMFAAFDKIEPRKLMYENWKANLVGLSEEQVSRAIFIDGRLLAEQLQIFTIRGDDSERMITYETQHLFGEEEAAEALCSFKQTTHVAAMIAALMVSNFTNHLTNLSYGSKVRNVPFYLEYFTPIHLLTLEQ